MYIHLWIIPFLKFGLCDISSVSVSLACIEDITFVLKAVIYVYLSFLSVDCFLHSHIDTNRASVEHHGVQPTGCMDNEPEPSRGVPC